MISSEGSNNEILGRTVRILLSHLTYDGRLTETFDFFGKIETVNETSIDVILSDGKRCLLRPDLRIFTRSSESDFEVHVGCVGVGYIYDLRRCLYQRREIRRSRWRKSK